MVRLANHSGALAPLLVLAFTFAHACSFTPAKSSQEDATAHADTTAFEVVPLEVISPSDTVDTEQTPALEPDPGQWGPYQVGTTTLDLFDEARQRKVRTVVWYPALPDGEPLVTYLLFVQGKAFVDPPGDPSAAPYPLVLFSHGFNGVAEQSISFTEHLASHGYVVVAMDHDGNTIKDASASDEHVAWVALQRPTDVRFAYDQVLALSGQQGALLTGMVDEARVAMSGHSFGAYNALMVAGGEVNVDEAKGACDAGTPADIFCPYIAFWPQGQVVSMEAPIPNLSAVFSMCPGGSAAFGSNGLGNVAIPKLLVGGTLDQTTPVDIELDPIYNSLAAPKMRAILKDGAHLSFTNVCDIPVAAAALQDFCGVEGMLGADEVFPIVNTLAVAFFNVHLKGLTNYSAVFNPEFVAENLPQVVWTVD